MTQTAHDNGPTDWRRLDRIEASLREEREKRETLRRDHQELEARFNAGIARVFESLESLRAEVVMTKHQTMVRALGRNGALVGAVVAAIEAWRHVAAALGIH